MPSRFCTQFFECTFFDVWVFNPHTPSNRHPRCYRKHELEKKRHYEQRVREVEHASFILPLLFCQQLVVWPMKQQCSTRGLPPAWPPNGINPIAEQCPGFDADLLFPFFDQQFSVSGVLAPAVDTQPSFRLHQWTWSYLNLNLFSFLLLSLF